MATSKLVDLEKLEDLSADDPRTGAPRCTEASMVFRRLKVYKFHHRVSKPPLRARHSVAVASRALCLQARVRSLFSPTIRVPCVLSQLPWQRIRSLYKRWGWTP